MKFLKTFLAVILALITFGVIKFVLFCVFLGAVMSMNFSDTVTLTAPQNSVLEITLNEQIIDEAYVNTYDYIDPFNFEFSTPISLLNVLRTIEKAKTDANIKGIYLNLSSMKMVSATNLEEIRNALIDFKTSGKFIVAYNEIYSQSNYYLASVADEVYLYPQGEINFDGIGFTGEFYKKLLDKLGASVEVFRPTECKYKSAVEPFILDKFSPENRAQMQQLANSIWSKITLDIAKSRNISVDKLNMIADSLWASDAELAYKNNLVDSLIYQDQFFEILKAKGVEFDDNSPRKIKLKDYLAHTNVNIHGKPQVALLYAEGQIADVRMPVERGYATISAKTIRSARLDENVKAVVLRINSPGGSALTSDLLWRELKLLQKEKPLIVSMGSAAASGGYYIAAMADSIVANNLSITGSIGVFGIKPNLENTLDEKLGITFDKVKTNSSTDYIGLGKMSAYEIKHMQKSVDKIYSNFIGIVVDGRKMSRDSVLFLAQGKMYSGADAAENKLVDEIGGIQRAIEIAAQKANIQDNYAVNEFANVSSDGFMSLLGSVKYELKNSQFEFLQNLFDYSQVREILAPVTAENGMIMYHKVSVEL